MATDQRQWFRIGTLGQKTMASSTPVVLPSDMTPIPVVPGPGGGPFEVVGTKAPNAGPPGATNLGTLPAVATLNAPVYTEGQQVPASVDLSGALRVNVAVIGNNPALGANGLAAPLFSIQGGGTDGVNLRPFRMFDLNTGAGEEFNQGFSWRFSSPVGSVEAGTAAFPVRVDPTGTTTQPVSAASLPLPAGAATAANQITGNASLASIDAKLTPPLVVSVTNFPATQPVSGTVTANQGTGAGAAAPWSTRLSDGAAFYVAAQTGQFPAALVGGRLDTNLGAWLGSTAPTVGQKAMAASLPVAIASDQAPVPVSGTVTIGGTVDQGTGNANPAQGWSARLTDGVAFYKALTDAELSARLNTLGQKAMAASAPVVIASDQSTLNAQGVKSNNAAVPGATNLGTLPAVATAVAPVYVEGRQVAVSTDLAGATRITGTVTAIVRNDKATYSAATSGLVVAALATDIFTLTGSASKTVRITRLAISGFQNASGQELVQLIKRSAANTGGTSTAPTIVPHDSTNAAGTATVLAYTANPTLGASVGATGLLRASYILIPGAGGGISQSPVVLTFGDRPDAQHIVLRGTNEVLAVNLNGVTIPGARFALSIEYTEES